MVGSSFGFWEELPIYRPTLCELFVYGDAMIDLIFDVYVISMLQEQ